MMHPTYTASVTDVWYGTTQINQQPQDVLWIAYEIDGTEHTDFIPNGNWTSNNITLQTLAYLGLQPSDMDDPDKPVPVHYSEGDWLLDRTKLVSWGGSSLKDVDWFTTT